MADVSRCSISKFESLPPHRVQLSLVPTTRHPEPKHMIATRSIHNFGVQGEGSAPPLQREHQTSGSPVISPGPSPSNLLPLTGWSRPLGLRHQAQKESLPHAVGPRAAKRSALASQELNDNRNKVCDRSVDVRLDSRGLYRDDQRKASNLFYLLEMRSILPPP